MREIKNIFFIVMFSLALNACVIKIDLKNPAKKSENVISGLATPFLGLIADSASHSLTDYLFPTARAIACADPVYAKLYRIQADGTIDADSPLTSQLLAADAKYSFSADELGLSSKSVVEYIIVAEGCNGESFKRPLTGFDKNQNIDASTTIIGWTLNAHDLLANKLHEVSRADVDKIMKELSGNNLTDALNSLVNDAGNAALFTQIFGTSPSAIENAAPEVKTAGAQVGLNELAVANFSLQTFHVNPAYSYAYEWKVDTVLKSTASSLNYIPTANQQGTHTLSVRVGKDDGAGNVDMAFPSFVKTFTVMVNNNVLPVAPNFALAAGNPSPTKLSSIDIDVDTGAGLANCETFSTMAYTLTSTPPGAIAFNQTCSVNNSQPMAINLAGSDGVKTIYLWAKDSEGNISLASTQNITYDTTAPSASFDNIASTGYVGGGAYTFNVSMSDALSGIAQVVAQVSSNGGTTFSDITTSATGISSFNYTFPAVNSSTYQFRLKVTDAAGNERVVNTASLTVDAQAPSALAFTRTSSALSALRNVDLSVTCTADNAKVLFSESSSTPLLSDGAWENCAATKTFQVSAGDGLKTIYAFTRDAAGNISPSSTETMTLDATAPLLSLTSFTSGSYKGGSTYNITWTLTDDHLAAAPVTLEYTTDGTNYISIATAQANSGSYAWSVPALDINTLKVKITAVDQLAQSSSAVSPVSLIIDSNSPVPSTFTVPGGATATNNRNILLNIAASDSQTSITHFCLKVNNSTAPLAGDACWISVAGLGETLSKNLNLIEYPYQLSNLQGTYTLKAWFKDVHNRISTNSGTLNTDTYTMTYNPNPPPTLANITAASTDVPSSPLSMGDTTATAGSDLFIKWNATDNVALPSGSISLYYSTDEVTYTLIASNLDNAQGAGCSITASETGCFKWVGGSPTSSYYLIKLVATDSSNQTVYELANAVNTGNTRFLSGNTNLGLGAAATKAIFINDSEVNYADEVDNQALAVTKTGYIFFKYSNRGIVYISPLDGVVRDLIFTTGTSAGDGGSVFSATLKSAERIDLDPEENLIIWDYNRIRKVDLSTNPWKITTLVGGGADTTSGADALSASLPLTVNPTQKEPMTILPNGTIYFEKGREIWYYDPQDSKVKLHLALTGVGTDDLTGWYASYDNGTCLGRNISIGYNKTTSAITKIMRRMAGSGAANCGALENYNYRYNTNFDPATGIATAPHAPRTDWTSTKFTGKDGKIYVLNHNRKSLLAYNETTNTFDRILGHATNNGRCADGTSATLCSSTIMSAFVNEFGRVYFVDMGVIRVIDDEGKVQTLAGQPRNFGAGFNPLSARFSVINYFEVGGDDVYVKNDLENQIMHFSLAGGNLSLIAGNSLKGQPTAGNAAVTEPLGHMDWAKSSGIILDSANNRLYHYMGQQKMGYINLATGKWVIQSTTNLQDDPVNSRVSYLGYNGDSVLVNVTTPDFSGGVLSTLKVSDTATAATTTIYGSNAHQAQGTGTICNGSVGTTCILPTSYQDNTLQLRYPYDSDTNEWLIATKNKKAISRLPNAGGVVTLYETTAESIRAFDFFRDGSNNEFIFYCAMNGLIYKRNVATNVETVLPFPTSSMSCSGSSLYYNASRDSVMYSYEQHGLEGIAEYVNP